MSQTQSELRLATLLDERATVQKLHETVIGAIEANEGNVPSDSQTDQIKTYREKAESLDHEILELSQVVDSNRKAEEASRAIRKMLAGSVDGVDIDEEGVVYRSFAAYARDEILTRTGQECSKIASLAGGDSVILAAKERLNLAKRTPANTLSGDVPGLIPDQHIAQIFQVIDKSRPLVASAIRTALERGTLTYPRIDASPVVAVQGTEKTEAGNTGMDISMQSALASTYLGGGDLSWQAINWSTPNALQLWFDLAAADYALKTEQDAAQVMQHSAFSNNISSPISSTPTFAQFMAGIGAGYAEVFANSGRIADTVYLAPDRFGYLLGLTSDAFAQFTQAGSGGIGPMSFVISRGMDAGVVVVGDRQGLLVAETAGAPVELRVVEPAIGGVEVGIIGAFEAVVVDDGAFAMVTTAS